MATPPQHSITARIEYISKHDPAWDIDRINAELDGLEPDQIDEHPATKYFRGETRFDLDAPGTVYLLDGTTRQCAMREYLKPGVEPVTWEQRRLTVAELSVCEDLGGVRGNELALRYALAGVTGIDFNVEPPRRGKLLREGVVEALSERVGADMLWDVGASMREASKQPTRREAKPSGS